ncbi:MAG: sensor-containing diguanylate cyclase/phosphodiesterase [Candidatus Eremiobacteraeota bacterium]|nr:sensor-containing diguanylate cyclase/phosphodiesterase [Candidatus Eremiobacteraeota bacterium]
MTIQPASSARNPFAHLTAKRAFTDSANPETPPRGARVRATSLITVAASVGLVVVLIVSIGVALFASTATSAAEDRADEARTLGVLYADARFLVVLEQSLEDKYRLEPGPDVARAHEAAAHELAVVLRTIVRLAPPANAAEALRLLELHKHYRVTAHAMFAAIAAKDLARAQAIDHGSLDPVYASIQDAVYQRATQQGRLAGAAFESLNVVQRSAVRVEFALSVLGLACVLGLLFVIYAYRSRLVASHEAEVRRLEEAMFVDSLTTVGNHRAFKDDLNREISLAARFGLPLTLAMLDIDEFKLVNDQNGHVYGDRVLVELARVLRAGRVEDRAYRVGGDEFAIILPHTSADGARAVLERIRLAASTTLHGSTVSIGFSTADAFDITAEALQHQADAALYHTKRGGRNGVSQFDAANKGTWLLSTERVQSLRALLASGTLPIAFQPIWDLERAEILAFEALLRPAASFGFAGPQDAFDVAERLGCAHELDRASGLSALRRAGDLPAHALLFLNVSPQTLDRDFDVAEFAAAVATAGLRPERVVIEITERSIAHIDNVIAVARALKAAGFGIALDDTGSGHAGLEIMSRLQFDYVKIDRAIIVKAMGDRSASGVVAAIVAFAKVTGAYVIAEGIEDIPMLDFIDRSKCARAPVGRGIRGAQGYLLNRPSETLPAPGDVLDVSALLREHLSPDASRPRWLVRSSLPVRSRSTFVKE